MLAESTDDDEVIARVAALDIGKAELRDLTRYRVDVVETRTADSDGRRGRSTPNLTLSRSLSDNR
jgi:hypothetical protein